MDKSIFTKAYLYTNKGNRNNLENYLTEIFAHCIDIDPSFRSALFKIIGVTNPYIRVQTQFTINNNRPDILIECENTIIFIECKIESGEQNDQLVNYRMELMKSNHLNKYLIYLTKYSVLTSDCDKHIRWLEIINLISNENHDVTKEMKKFIKENNIAMNTNIKPLDLIVLNNIKSVIEKMSDALNSISGYFTDRLGPLAGSTPELGLRSENEFIYYKSHNSVIRRTDIGFMWSWQDDDNIYAGVSFAILYLGNENIVKELKEFLPTWDSENIKGTIWFTRRKNLIEIMANENNHISELTNYFTICIDELVELKIKFPQYLS